MKNAILLLAVLTAPLALAQNLLSGCAFGGSQSQGVDLCSFKLKNDPTNALQWAAMATGVQNSEQSGFFPDADFVYLVLGELLHTEGEYHASIATPYFTSNGNTNTGRHCFSFWVRASGWPRQDNAAQYMVYAKSASRPANDDRLYLLISQITDINGNVWRYHEIDFSFESTNTSVVVETVAGESVFSYFAMDATRLTEGSCESRNDVGQYDEQVANCPGNFLMRDNEPVGMHKATFSECAHMCDADVTCRGFSFILDKGTSVNYEAFQCFLKTESCTPTAPNTNHAYIFYTKRQGSGGGQGGNGGQPTLQWFTPSSNGRSIDCWENDVKAADNAGNMIPVTCTTAKCQTLQQCQDACLDYNRVTNTKACKGVSFVTRTDVNLPVKCRYKSVAQCPAVSTWDTMGWSSYYYYLEQ